MSREGVFIFWPDSDSILSSPSLFSSCPFIITPNEFKIILSGIGSLAGLIRILMSL